MDTKGLYDPTTSYFYLSNSVSGAYADITIGFGVAGWVPIAGDWDGDGVDTIGLYDATNSVFYLRDSNTTGGANYQIAFGQANWTPVVGDWNGDGKDTIGLYNPTTSYFYLCNSNSVASADYTLGFGAAGWKPIAGDWNSDGYAGIGLYDTAGTFYLRNTLSTGSADVTFTFTGGGSTWLPIAGHWSGTNLLADSVIADAWGVTALTDTALAPLLQEALAQWAAAGIQADVLHKLASVNVQITDLPGAQLGTVCGDTIYIDATAAGHGWFVDSTPEANEEFLYQEGQSCAIDFDAIDHMDLLTVLEHELGHVAGLEDLAADAHSLMTGVLSSGLRRQPTAVEVDAIFAEA